MRNLRGRWIVVAGVATALLLGLGFGYARLAQRDSADAPANLDLATALGGGNTSGFAHADRRRAFHFPRDHGPHPAFRNEWWYFTGNLRTPKGRRFGYELTLFRIALSPKAHKRASHWATNQVYMGHFAITDVAGRRFHYYERFVRNAAGLAGAQAEPFRVWAEDWSVQASRRDARTWRLHAAAPGDKGGVTLSLDLVPLKPVVLQGDHGLSQKSAAVGNASYYYSLTRIDSRGILSIGGKRFRVRGLSWMDREWGTSTLSDEQAGWDWFSLHLSDGSDLMFYQLRHKDGSIDAHSEGVLVDAQGRSMRLRHSDVRLKVLDTWTSPRGGTYPARWRLTVKPADLEVEIRPLLADQELAVSVRYWEGAVAVTGTRRGHALSGRGYAELTGYARNPAAAP